MLSLGVFALGVVNIALAAGGSTVSVSSSDAKMVSPERIPPYQQNPVNYIFDQTGVKTLINGKSTLLQVNCNSTAILQALGLGATTKKIFSI